jgi:hypothetical protein
MNAIKAIFLGVGALLALSGLWAQTPAWLWATGTGSETGYDSARTVVSDDQGNQYITGGFFGTVQFGDHTLTSAGMADIYVAKLSPSGNWINAWRAGGPGWDMGTGITLNRNVDTGIVIVTGYFSENADFFIYPNIQTFTSAGGMDIFVGELRTYGLPGDHLGWDWVVQAGGGGDDIPNSIAWDTAITRLYVTGTFEQTAEFGSHSITSSGITDIFVAGMNQARQWIWAERAGGTGYDYGEGIAVSNVAGCYDIYVSGAFHSTADFGSTTFTCLGATDIYAAKLTSGGNWLWAVRAGGTGGDYSHGLALDSANNACLTGYCQTADFGPHSITAGWMDIFAAKIDSGGNWLWASGAGGNSMDDMGYAIAADGAGSFYITGYFCYTAEFGSHILSSNGYGDAFAAKVDPNGNWLWAVGAGGTGYDRGYGISLDATGVACVAGVFEETASFGNINLTSYGATDIFVAKLDSGGVPVDDGLHIDTPGTSPFLAVWPNPVRSGDIACVKAGIAGGESGILTVCNLRGQVIAEYRLSPGTRQIELDWGGLPAGIYLFGLRTRSGCSVRKILLLN